MVQEREPYFVVLPQLYNTHLALLVFSLQLLRYGHCSTAVDVYAFGVMSEWHRIAVVAAVC